MSQKKGKIVKKFIMHFSIHTLRILVETDHSPQRILQRNHSALRYPRKPSYNSMWTLKHAFHEQVNDYIRSRGWRPLVERERRLTR